MSQKQFLYKCPFCDKKIGLDKRYESANEIEAIKCPICQTEMKIMEKISDDIQLREYRDFNIVKKDLRQNIYLEAIKYFINQFPDIVDRPQCPFCKQYMNGTRNGYSWRCDCGMSNLRKIFENYEFKNDKMVKINKEVGDETS